MLIREENPVYKGLVYQIKNLRWDRLTPRDLRSVMVLSWYAASEFASSLRIALVLHPQYEAFNHMAKGELNADNLQFADYREIGDHAHFLFRFANRHNLFKLVPKEIIKAGGDYASAVNQLTNAERVMSIVSREQQLPGIFEAILGGGGWDGSPELNAFRYYLERHIALDSGEGGHADLLSGYPVTDLVSQFYRARLNMYRSVPILFS